MAAKTESQSTRNSFYVLKHCLGLMICQHGVYLEDKIQGRIADGIRYVSRNFK